MAMTFGMGTLERFGYPTVKVVSTQHTNVTYRRTNRQTTERRAMHDGIPYAALAQHRAEKIFSPCTAE